MLFFSSFRFCFLFFVSCFCFGSAAPPLGTDSSDQVSAKESPIRIDSIPIELTDDGVGKDGVIFGIEQETLIETGRNEASLPVDTTVAPVVNESLTEDDAQLFMKNINEEGAIKNNDASIKSWNYYNNLTEENKLILLESTNAYGEYAKDRWHRIQKWKNVWPTFSNENLKRQFKHYSVLGTPALPKEKFERLTYLSTEMEEIYGKGKICDYKNSSKCDLSLEPDIESILKESKDYDELSHVWKSWRDVVGKPVKIYYEEFINLNNEAAVFNDFPTSAEMWTHDYESDTFQDDIHSLYTQLKPLYEQLHAYTRRKLREVYGESRISKRGAIPAHVTGNMWAQTWSNIYDLLVPYPNKTSIDVTQTMKEQGFTPLSMFQKADDFFASMNLERVPELFWNNSVIEKPSDRELVCHASAWDFSDGKDFRIKQCTDVDMEDFFTVHHELGHIQYYLQYKHLPFVFQGGANPGFHEAVGDVLSLSVSTPKHLTKVGLLASYETDDEADINFLMKTALDKVAFLPFSYLIDRYRWEIMRGDIMPQNYNTAWWKLRYSLQGIASPVERTEEDFDPAAKYHVSANVKYIRYFVANILQFQFYKASCLLAKEYDHNDPQKPLHRCDIYQSVEAGNALKDMLKMGSSVHWSESLKVLTGSDVMNASALREYFAPLEKWLIADNEKNGEFIGWEGGFEQLFRTETPTLSESEVNTSESTAEIMDGSNMTESAAEAFMLEINAKSALLRNNNAKLSWNFQTNITDYNKQKMVDSKIEHGKYAKERWQQIQEWKAVWPTFTNESLKRQFYLYSVLGTPALSTEKYEMFTHITTDMRSAYSTGKICDFKNSSKCDLKLEPEIKNILKESRDYDELLYVWKTWRDVAGKPVRNLFSELVELSNEAATLNGFPSTAEMWAHNYESDTFEDDIASLYNQLRPLYNQLHAYTRRNLREVYGESKVSKRGLIPAHLTGNMWAQTWGNLYDMLVPYPNQTSMDVTSTMVEQGYTPLTMFKKADDFFASLNMSRVPDSFWNNSVIERPEGIEMVCHASAWDFSDGKDFRIKQCTEVSMEDFHVVHHELGHIQYFMNYKHLPYAFRSGANSGFHEAVGDVISLSVATPKHLNKVGLLETYEPNNEADINFLMQTALEKVAFLPFAYMIDKYRWEVFRGGITPENYTKAWWEYRHALQGVKSPIPRTETDFDPAAKSHVSSNTKYIRYFVANILQFQFHKAVCLIAKEYDSKDPEKPLHRCDIYQSKEAGEALKTMLKLGSSVHWSQPLKALTGTETMDASALREYFRPLENWLIADNEKHGEFIGWLENE